MIGCDSYQNFDIRRDEIVKSYGIRLSDEDIQKILPYCNALEYEKYRNKEMSTSDEGYIGYRDEVTMYFTAITDSYIPKIELPMEYYYDRAHEWPSERLYRFLVENYLDGNKIEELKGWGPNWGGFSLFWRPFEKAQIVPANKFISYCKRIIFCCILFYKGENK